MALNERIRLLRTAHRLTQEELSKAIGVRKQTVSNWENNNIQPSVDMVVRLALFFGVTTDHLLDLDSRIFIEVTNIGGDKVTHLCQIAKDLGAEIEEKDQ